MRTNLLLAILVCLGGCESPQPKRHMPVYDKTPICNLDNRGKTVVADSVPGYSVCICDKVSGVWVWNVFGFYNTQCKFGGYWND